MNGSESGKDMRLRAFLFLLIPGVLAACFMVTCADVNLRQEPGRSESATTTNDSVDSLLEQAAAVPGSAEPLPMSQVEQSRRAILERAMRQAESLPEGRERNSAIMRVLAARGTLGTVSDTCSLRKAHAMAMELGERDVEGKCLMYLSREDGEGDKLDAAIAIFRESGNRALLSEALTWRIMNLITEGRYGQAASLIPEMRESGETGPSGETVTRSMEGFLADMGKIPSGNRLLSYNCNAEILVLGDDLCISYAGQPGIGGSLGSDARERRFEFSLFWEMQNSGDFLRSHMKQGESVEVKSFSFGREPLSTRVNCVSESETLVVPAGRYYNCRHLRFVTTDTGESAMEARSDEGVRKLNALLAGTREVWYAPGTGIVKFRRIQENHESSMVLVKYKGKGCTTPIECFPLSAGAEWTYGVETDNMRGYRAVYTVRAEFNEGDTWYLSHRGYVVRFPVVKRKRKR